MDAATLPDSATLAPLPAVGAAGRHGRSDGVVRAGDLEGAAGRHRTAPCNLPRNGRMFVAIAPLILIEYIAPDESENPSFCCLFFVAVCVALALPALLFLRKLSDPQPRT
jgi:hypothetical protein